MKILIIILIFIFIPISYLPHETKALPPTQGPWKITDVEEYVNQKILIEGNITIHSGGKLILKSTELKINSTFEGEFHIEILAGGTMEILDGDGDITTHDESVIKSNNIFSYQFWVRNGGKLVIRNSILTDCGFSTENISGMGLYIESDDVILDGAYMSENYCNLVIVRKKLTIKNSSFLKSTDEGVYLIESETKFISCTFENSENNSIRIDGGSAEFNDCTFRSSKYSGIYSTNAEISIENSLFQLNKLHGIDGNHIKIRMKKNEFYDNMVGIYLNDSSGIIENTYMNGGNYGVHVYASTLGINNTTIEDAEVADIYLSRWEKPSTINLYNSTVKKSLFGDHDSRLYLNWLLFMRVKWLSTNENASGVKVMVWDKNRVHRYNFTTDEHGTIGPMIMPEYEKSRSGTYTYSPYTFGFKYGRYFNKTNVNMNNNTDILVYMDDVPPEITIKFPKNGTYTRKDSIEIRGRTDPTATLTIQGNEVDVGHNGNFSYEISLQEGTNMIEIKAVDIFLNENKTYLIVNKDTTPPKITVNIPMEGILTRSSRYTIEGTCEPETSIVINGNHIEVGGSGFFSYPITLHEGLNIIEIRCIDKLGNNITVIRHIIRDSTPPYIEIESPDKDITNKKSIEVCGKVEKNSTVEVNEIVAEVINNTFRCIIELSEGNNSLIIKAVDAAGNSNETRIWIILDITKPIINITYPPQNYITNMRYVVIEGYTEAYSTVMINLKKIHTAEDGFFTSNYSLKNGTNMIHVVVIDRAGNKYEMTLNITFDNSVYLTFKNLKDYMEVESSTLTIEGVCERDLNLTINGISVDVKEDGTFSHKLKLSHGENEIRIYAEDSVGNIYNTTYIVICKYEGTTSDYTLLIIAVGILILIVSAIATIYFVRERKIHRELMKEIEIEKPIVLKTEEEKVAWYCPVCGKEVDLGWTVCHTCNANVDVYDFCHQYLEKAREIEKADERYEIVMSEMESGVDAILYLSRYGADVRELSKEMLVAQQYYVIDKKIDKSQEILRYIVPKLIQMKATLEREVMEEEARKREEMVMEIEETLSKYYDIMDEMRDYDVDLKEMEKLYIISRAKLRSDDLEEALRFAKKFKKLVAETRIRVGLDEIDRDEIEKMIEEADKIFNEIKVKMEDTSEIEKLRSRARDMLYEEDYYEAKKYAKKYKKLVYEMIERLK